MKKEKKPAADAGPIKGRATGKADRRGPGDRRVTKQRRADKLKAQLDAQRMNRISAATSAGSGPLEFDVRLARAHGWTDAEIDKFWTAITLLMRRSQKRVERRHPEIYTTHPNGTVEFTGKLPP